jgi:hypothetical protein
MAKDHPYTDELRRVRSLLIVNSLQKRMDIRALESIRQFKQKLKWEPLTDLLIEKEVWEYIATRKEYDPKLVFCHPDVLLHNPTTSLYYRGLCGLSLKAVRDYFGAADSLEEGNSRARLEGQKALNMARTYNAFLCSIIKNSTDWTLDNGYRTIVATLGITLDGVMRNKVGSIAEERVRTMVLEWLIDSNLLVEPPLTKEQIYNPPTNVFHLRKKIVMKFGSEPDIAFTRGETLVSVIEIKGGIDPAGALERYGAATKSFQHSIRTSAHCKNFYLGAVFTPELQKRIGDDRIVEKTFNIIEILHKPKARARFFQEIFHHTLRVA